MHSLHHAFDAALSADGRIEQLRDLLLRYGAPECNSTTEKNMLRCRVWNTVLGVNEHHIRAYQQLVARGPSSAANRIAADVDRTLRGETDLPSREARSRLVNAFVHWHESANNESVALTSEHTAIPSHGPTHRKGSRSSSLVSWDGLSTAAVSPSLAHTPLQMQPQPTPSMISIAARTTHVPHTVASHPNHATSSSTASSSSRPVGGTPSSVYHQSMASLAAVLLFVYKTEADAFACFIAIVTGCARALYNAAAAVDAAANQQSHSSRQSASQNTTGHHQSPAQGVVRAGCALADALLTHADPAITQHLLAVYGPASSHADLMFFSRITAMYANRPPLQRIVRLWDALFAVGLHLLPLLCTAEAVQRRDELLAAGRDAVSRFQGLPVAAEGKDRDVTNSPTNANSPSLESLSIAEQADSLLTSALEIATSLPPSLLLALREWANCGRFDRQTVLQGIAAVASDGHASSKFTHKRSRQEAQLIQMPATAENAPQAHEKASENAAKASVAADVTIKRHLPVSSTETTGRSLSDGTSLVVSRATTVNVSGDGDTSRPMFIVAEVERELTGSHARRSQAAARALQQLLSGCGCVPEAPPILHPSATTAANESSSNETNAPSRHIQHTLQQVSASPITGIRVIRPHQKDTEVEHVSTLLDTGSKGSGNSHTNSNVRSQSTPGRQSQRRRLSLVQEQQQRNMQLLAMLQERREHRMQMTRHPFYKSESVDNMAVQDDRENSPFDSHGRRKYRPISSTTDAIPDAAQPEAVPSAIQQAIPALQNKSTVTTTPTTQLASTTVPRVGPATISAPPAHQTIENRDVGNAGKAHTQDTHNVTENTIGNSNSNDIKQENAHSNTEGDEVDSWSDEEPEPVQNTRLYASHPPPPRLSLIDSANPSHSKSANGLRNDSGGVNSDDDDDDGMDSEPMPAAPATVPLDARRLFGVGTAAYERAFEGDDVDEGVVLRGTERLPDVPGLLTKTIALGTAPVPAAVTSESSHPPSNLREHNRSASTLRLIAPEEASELLRAAVSHHRPVLPHLGLNSPRQRLVASSGNSSSDGVVPRAAETGGPQLIQLCAPVTAAATTTTRNLLTALAPSDHLQSRHAASTEMSRQLHYSKGFDTLNPDTSLTPLEAREEQRRPHSQPANLAPLLQSPPVLAAAPTARQLLWSPPNVQRLQPNRPQQFQSVSQTAPNQRGDPHQLATRPSMHVPGAARVNALPPTISQPPFYVGPARRSSLVTRAQLQAQHHQQQQRQAQYPHLSQNALTTQHGKNRGTSAPARNRHRNRHGGAKRDAQQVTHASSQTQSTTTLPLQQERMHVPAVELTTAVPSQTVGGAVPSTTQTAPPLLSPTLQARLAQLITVAHERIASDGWRTSPPSAQQGTFQRTRTATSSGNAKELIWPESTPARLHTTASTGRANGAAMPMRSNSSNRSRNGPGTTSAPIVSRHRTSPLATATHPNNHENVPSSESVAVHDRRVPLVLQASQWFRSLRR